MEKARVEDQTQRSQAEEAKKKGQATDLKKEEAKVGIGTKMPASLFIDFYLCVFLSYPNLALGADSSLTIMFKHCSYIPSYISYAKVYSYVAPLHLAVPMLHCVVHLAIPSHYTKCLAFWSA